jgi:hypothetical protein
VELGDFEFDDRGDEVEVKVTLYTEDALAEEDAQRLREQLSEAIGRPARLRLVTIPVTEFEAAP